MEYRYYFQLKDHFAVKNEKRSLIPKTESTVHALAGSLWYIDSKTVSKDSKELRALSNEYDDVYLVIDTTSNQGLLQEISEKQYYALIALKSCKLRLNTFQSSELRNLDRFTVGQVVDIVFADSNEVGCGVIRYVGPLPSVQGTWFGVELIGKLRGRGNSNGSFKNKVIFSCEENNGVFVTINQLKLHKPESALESGGGGIVTLGERVVWISDLQPEFGTVRWVGYLPGSSSNSELTVGVEFDNPVGTGTGRYQDQQLFSAKMNHASLVPILGLMKESDFLSFHSSFVVAGEPMTTSTGKVTSRQQHIEQQQAGSTATRSKRGPSPLRSQSHDVPGTYPGSRVVQQTSKDGRPDPKSIYDTYKRSDNASDPIDGANKPLAREAQQAPAARVAVVGNSSSPLHSPDARLPQPTDAAGGGGGFMLPEHLRIVNKLSPGRIATESSTGTAHMPTETHAEQHRNLRPTASINPTPIDPVVHNIDLEIGAMVEIVNGAPNCRYGVVKWLGRLRQDNNKIYAGVQMEQESESCTDGSFQGVHVFDCLNRKAFFVNVSSVRRDPRFQDNNQPAAGGVQRQDSNQRFGKVRSPDIDEPVEPPLIVDLNTSRARYVGRERGIQGHHNSCYLDATLFTIFSFSTAMDAMLFRTPLPGDLDEFEEVQKVLRDGIVNPLRKNFYVRADKVMKLRQMLARLTHDGEGLLGEEKDPEEFLKILLQDVFQCEPLLKLSSNQSTYLLPLIMEKDASLKVPTTQQLLDRSCHQERVKLIDRPSCMMLQMPRFGKDYKMFEKIIPSLKLDIGSIINDAPRVCEMCGQAVASLECADCHEDLQVPHHSFYCAACCRTYHQHPKRLNHQPKAIVVNPLFENRLAQYVNSQQTGSLDEEMLELYGVICIATSHYVSFVKCGQGDNAPWLFFDSMADRVGGQDGYNIPEVIHCQDIYDWLDPVKVQAAGNRDIPPLVRRLLCDSYICLYQHPLLTMYK